MTISATKSDAKILTEIALKSKAVWSYTKENLESWRSDLTITSTMVEEMMIFKFLQDDKIAGFYALNPPLKSKCCSELLEESFQWNIELEMLFVLPEFIGKGIGKKLLQHAIQKARISNCKSMILLADPNAKAFYKSQGFVVIDEKESSIPNRFLPIMKLSW